MNNNPYFILKIKYENSKKAKVIYNSILNEHKDSQIKSNSIMKLNSNTIYIKSEAKELSILKASFYSYIRWIEVAEKIFNLCN